VTIDGSAETDGNLVITTTSTGANIITLGNGNDSYIVAGVGTGVATVVATDGTNIITTGAGDDIITLGGGTDTVSAGGGADIVLVAVGSLTASDTIAGGTGANILSATGAGTIIDNDFANVTLMQTLTETGADAALLVTLGAKAAAAGIVTIIDAAAANSYTIGAGFTNNLAITLTTGADTINASAYTKVLTITTTADSDIVAADGAITGGTGLLDEVKLIGGTDIDAGEMADLSKFEKMTITSDISSSIVLADSFVAAGKSATISAAGITTVSKTMTISGLAEVDGTLNIIGSKGIDTITGGSLADTISMGVDAADDILIVKDTTMDTITNFKKEAGNDIIHLDISSLETAGQISSSAVDYALMDDGASQGNGAWSVQEIADQAGGAAVAAGTDKNVFVLIGQNYATEAAAADAITTGDHEITVAAAVADGDSIMIIYTDGTATYIAAATFTNNPGTNPADGDIVVNNMLKLTGTAHATLVADDFAANNGAFIA